MLIGRGLGSFPDAGWEHGAVLFRSFVSTFLPHIGVLCRAHPPSRIALISHSVPREHSSVH